MVFGKEQSLFPHGPPRLCTGVVRQAQAQTDLRYGSGIGPHWSLLREQRHQCNRHSEERQLQAACGPEAGAGVVPKSWWGQADSHCRFEGSVDIQRLDGVTEGRASSTLAL